VNVGAFCGKAGRRGTANSPRVEIFATLLKVFENPRLEVFFHAFRVSVVGCGLRCRISVNPGKGFLRLSADWVVVQLQSFTKLLFLGAP